MKSDEELYQEAMENIPADSLEFADLSFAIVDRVHAIMARQKMNQKMLAEKLGKRESEVSRWLGGMHNLTLRNMARLNVALGEKVIVVPPADAVRQYHVLCTGVNQLYGVTLRNEESPTVANTEQRSAYA